MYDYASYLVPHHVKSLRFYYKSFPYPHAFDLALIRLVGNPRGLQGWEPRNRNEHLARIISERFRSPCLSRLVGHHRLPFRRSTNTLSANGQGRTNISHIGTHHCPYAFFPSTATILLRPSLHTISFILPTWLQSTQIPLLSYSTTIRQQLQVGMVKDGLEEDRNHCPSSRLGPLYHLCTV